MRGAGDRTVRWHGRSRATTQARVIARRHAGFFFIRAFRGADKEKAWRQPTLPRLQDAVPSARRGLTSVFGMGTGGTPLL